MGNEMMMWFDNVGSLQERIQRACKYYFGKYGKKPSLVQVSARELEKAYTIDGVRVEPVRSVVIYHIWVGLDPLAGTGVEKLKVER